MNRWGVLLLVGCSVVEVEAGAGTGADPEQIEVATKLWLPPRGDLETGGSVEVFCPEGFELVEEGRRCEASDPRVFITAIDISHDGAHVCGVRNDAPGIEWVLATAMCEAQ